MIPTQTPGRRITNVLIHVIVIAMLCVLPNMLVAVSDPHPLAPMVYLKAGIYVAVFYFDFFIAAPKCMYLRRGSWNYIWINLGVIVVAMVMCVLATWGVVKSSHAGEGLQYVSLLLRDLAMIVLVIGLSTAIRLSQNWVERESKTQQVLASRRADELRSLRSQLHPHFLFNTLNSIYALIDISPERARTALHELSKLLRYTLYDNRGESVTLRHELEFARHFIELQTLRLPDPSRIKLTIDADGCEEWKLTPLLFITLLENVFKHGLSAPGPVEISIIASKATNTVSCRTVNPIAPVPNSSRRDGGIGLKNLRRRLQLIYGPTATLTVNVSDKTFDIVLEVPLAPYYTETPIAPPDNDPKPRSALEMLRG